MTLALTLCAVLAAGLVWLLVASAFGVALGRFLRGTDQAARQLHNEERRRRGHDLDELAPRRRRRPQR